MAAKSSGFLVQSSHGATGNYEVVVPRGGGGAAHFWRDNDAPGFPWHGPNLAFASDGDLLALSLIQSSLGAAGNLDLVALENGSLFHIWRDDGASWRWQKRTSLPGAVTVVGPPALVQSSNGAIGNFEVVAPVAGGGLAHWWRDNDDPSFSWWGPSIFGAGAVEAAAAIHGSYGKLDVVVRIGDQLSHYWRDDGATWAWNGPYPIGGGAVGSPAFVQGIHGGNGNYELVTPSASGGLDHWWRDNDDGAAPWYGPNNFGVGPVDALGLVAGSSGKLEVITLSGGTLAHYWRDDGASWAWNGPYPFHVEPALDSAQFGLCEIPFTSPVVGIHQALLPSGKIVQFAYSDFDDHVGVSTVVDPATGTNQPPPDSHHLFCSGHAFLGDGRLLVAGGHHADLSALHIYDPDPPVEGWIHEGEMAHGRWYPTCTSLPNGNVLVMSGTKGHGGPVAPSSPVNNTIEIYDPAAGLSGELAIPEPFSVHFPAGFDTVDLYPFVYVLPSGKLLVHSRNTTRFYDPATDTWDADQIPNQYPFSRTYPGEATSVILPLLPSSDPPYRVQVMVFGGGGADPEQLGQFTPATNTVEILDLGVAPLAWRYTAPMSSPRVMPDAVLLPDGTVLVVGGSATGKADIGIDPVLDVERFDPATETWSAMAPSKVPRLYHASALLLPDGRVLMAGTDGIYNMPPYDVPQHRIEIFSPPYLFNGPRPAIADAPPLAALGEAIQVASPAALDVASAVLIRSGSVTHSFNMEQRLIGLTILGQTAGSITLGMPQSAAVAPPGYYLLFLLSAAGVPSIGEFIKLG